MEIHLEPDMLVTLTLDQRRLGLTRVSIPLQCMHNNLFHINQPLTNLAASGSSSLGHRITFILTDVPYPYAKLTKRRLGICHLI
jgi:hypothetical protein